MSSPRTIASHASLTIEALDSVIIAAWSGASPVADEVRSAIGDAVEYAKARTPCGLIVAIPPNMPLPSEAIRQVIEIEMRQLDPFLSCGATVITRKGLVGIALRAIVSAIQLVSRPTHPERIFASGEEAASYVRAKIIESGAASPTKHAILQKYHALASGTWRPPS